MVSTKSYSAKTAKFYDDQHIIYTHLKDNEIRHVNIESYKGQKYKGHTEEVTSLSVTPKYFFTGSKDNTARMWDPREIKDVACKNLPHVPFVTNSNNYLAVAYNSSIIEIYEVRDLQNHVHRRQYEKRAEWTGIQFSPDGSMLLITTNSTYIFMVQITGEELPELTGEIIQSLLTFKHFNSIVSLRL